MRRKVNFLFTMGLGALIGLTLVVGIGYVRLSNAAPNYEYLDSFTKVLHFVQSNYVEEVDTKKLMEGAIKGMLSELDPHSSYLPPDQYKDMKVDTSGKFGGLGIEITLDDGQLTVVTPIEDTPAFKAGVEPGDKIVKIVDKRNKIDKMTKGLSLTEAVKLMRGKKRTKVTIHVVREGYDEPIPITITRDIIKVVSVKSGLIEPNYAWLRITNFQSNTTRDLKKHLKKLIRKNKKENKKKLDGVVLDLRNNPGGLLEEAVSVSGLFLGNVPIVSTAGRNKEKKEVEYAKNKTAYKDFKVVVLVNQASASASEIVAGALQDHKRALIVGKTTFGKGSVQTVIDLGNKSGLKLTVARYYTPNGREIQSKGIIPDIEVDPINVELIELAKKGRFLKEADLRNHLMNKGEKGDKGGDKKKKQSRFDRRPIKTKDGKKIRMDDPKELLKVDYQLQQALSFLKAWNVFRTAGNYDENMSKKKVKRASK